MTFADTRSGLTTAFVDWADPDAARLRDEQQAELRARYGEDDIGHEMTGETIVAMLLVRDGDVPVACGALRDVADDQGPGTAEIKRLFVAPGHRGRGLSRLVMAELETRARELGVRRLILETGVLQPEAIGLYLALGYLPIENFGEYRDEPESRCFGKKLTDARIDVSEADVPHDEAVEVTAAGPRRAITLRLVEWDDPEAASLRRAMYDRTNRVLYPSLEAAVERAGGFAADDALQGRGALSTVVADVDGAPAGCATLRAAREGYPEGAGELKKVFVDESARGAGVARAMLAALEDDARARGLTQLVLMTGIRQPEAIRLYVSCGYRPIAPVTARHRRNPHGLWFAKPLV